jgi:dipeptidyl-peptidase-3
LVKENGKLVEKTWKVGGMYSAAIEKIVYWLEKAVMVAETPEQKKALELLVEYYKTGDLEKFDAYNVAWVSDVNSTLDNVNGFIEVYQDALGKRGTFEAVVSIKDFEATKLIETIAKNAQWFEDNAPLMPNHKKKKVKGIIGKSINVIVESGDAAPSTPIGINLPNSNWIRQQHGSKSVALGNIVSAYNIAGAKSPSSAEFSLNEQTLERAKKYGNLAAALHTDMHEVIGHASGQLEPGIATPDVTLKNYQNTLEEARADLVALYYIYDQKLVDIGVMPSLEVGMAEYESYLLNGLMLQLNRVEPGKNIEEAHMRNRQLVAKWVMEKGASEKVAELITRNGKTYVQINDYSKLRKLFGDLLREIQRIKSQGDFAAGQALVENYGVKVDTKLHKEVKERFAALNVAPYKGFIQPRLVAISKGDKIFDVKIEYPESFTEQMMEYSKKYSLLPLKN